ncbi:BZ3500_MvSof-1268-A1-R1_Chr7-1g09345 [Microbotryum saponariae]|uniref:BZ3500_MvSof-1268-A1-R1_Chr7-1g09345 protein n=1 Tax=Microbotryum saponariae TaxID=289078 RepID=A0A2X0N2Z4_9BASI|nr:BZ3501_MvSof-1269-A2-R1_Chr7-1g09050 [Microbotryum saponariae]SDA03269.1 BZ3500_MvSof-1268-A1-R1_Chr7-1g09345 [Microbotryum saponariae]
MSNESIVSPTSTNEPPPELTPAQLTRSTAELYARPTASSSLADSDTHHGMYAAQRKGLDWKYHRIPTKERQFLQDSIVSSVLARAHRDCERRQSDGPEESDHSKKPLALFTAGGMGAGKGHTLREMLKDGTIRLPRDFVWVDPDALARELPEREQYLRADAKTASKKLHPEAALLQEILSEVARSKRRSLVVDGSLSDCAWFSKLMKRYGADGYDCEIVFVTAPEEKMLERAQRRAKITGRITNPDALKHSREKSPHCVTHLSTPSHVRRARLVDNASDDAPSRIVYDSDKDPIWRDRPDDAGVDVKGFVDGRLEQGEDGVVREKADRKAHM